MLRSAFIFLSQQKQLRRWMEQSKFARPLTRRFVAGNTLEEALRVCAQINSERMLTTLDYLGESVTSQAEARRSLEHCMEAIQMIESRRLQSTISIKLTQMGLDIDDNLCFEYARQLVRLAKDTGSRIEFDMESSDHTDRTLRIVQRLNGEFGSVRAVIQAYLFRSENDIRGLNAQGIPIRLCKGAYAEPPEIAFAEKAQVDDNYLKLTQLLLEEGTDPAIATHDERMVAGAKRFDKRRFEFQMLYGVRRDLQRQLVQEGHRLRVYVPYGEAWYPYFMRRLAERPANVLFLARNFFKN